MIGDTLLCLAIAQDVILRLDQAEERRTISSDEKEFKKFLKSKALGLAALEKTWLRQLARLSWIKKADVNSKFFQLKVNARKRKNFIQSFQTANGTVTCMR